MICLFGAYSSLGLTTRKFEFFLRSTSPMPASKNPVTVSCETHPLLVCGPNDCIAMFPTQISSENSFLTMRRNVSSLPHLVADDAHERIRLLCLHLLRHQSQVPSRGSPPGGFRPLPSESISSFVHFDSPCKINSSDSISVTHNNYPPSLVSGTAVLVTRMAFFSARTRG